MPAPSLNVGKIVFGALVLPWRNRRSFGRALAAPFAALVALGIVQQHSFDSAPAALLVALIALYLLVFVVFAVTCHRLVLLDAPAIARARRPLWDRRNTRFLLRFVAVWLTCGIVALAMVLVLALSGVAGMAKEDSYLSKATVALAVLLPTFFVLARLSPVFPAAALDREAGFGWAWKLTAGNGTRMFLVVGVLPWIVSVLVGLPSRVLPDAAAAALTAVLGSLLLCVEIAALSLAYRELTRDEAATPPSPASPRTA